LLFWGADGSYFNNFNFWREEMLNTRRIESPIIKQLAAGINRKEAIANHVRRQLGGLPGIGDGEIHEAILRRGSPEAVISRLQQIQYASEAAARTFRDTFLRSEKPTIKLRNGVLKLR